ncbi:hypothetical protein FRB94_001247 [Tulasnella sp. JGI-2019a]|nr:hypothetical protein FRB94_001247 [Tulasnella sp. JGI-2019a]
MQRFHNHSVNNSFWCGQKQRMNNDTRSELETIPIDDAIQVRNAVVNQDPLPIELRVKIFEYTVAFDGPVPPKTYYPELHTLAQVCKTWSNIVRNSPSLWRVLSTCGAPAAALWHTAVTRSASVPLTIHLIDLPTGVEGFQPAHLTSLINNLARWEIVTIELHDVYMELSPIEVTGGAPHLRYLEMRLNMPLKTYLDLPRSWSPKIQHAKLSGLGLCRWDGCILAGLRTLMLHHVQSFVPSQKELLAILKNCPDLEDLDLDLYDVPCCSNGDLQTSEIQLLHLQSIKLDIHLPTMNVLLSRIHAPLCHTLFCRDGFEKPLDPAEVRQIIPFFVSQIEHHLPHIERIEVTISAGYLYEIGLYHDTDRVTHDELSLWADLDIVSCIRHMLDNAQPHQINLVVAEGI